jgi:hypothetical protein
LLGGGNELEFVGSDQWIHLLLTLFYHRMVGEEQAPPPSDTRFHPNPKGLGFPARIL